jgi:2-polyprenyl-3-methyl-5-hydroxy-6-metoxy-1,4-benzoquinol methylase
MFRSVSGKYHTVTCLDVMIHYPQVSKRMLWAVEVFDMV